MNVFNPRMLRSFAIGFALGALAVASIAGASHGGTRMVPAAVAAPAH